VYDQSRTSSLSACWLVVRRASRERAPPPRRVVQPRPPLAPSVSASSKHDLVSFIALSASATCALATDPRQHAPPCSQATPLAGRPPAPSPYHHCAPGMRAQYSPAQQQQHHNRPHPAAPPSPASSRLSNIAQRSSASAGPASPARPSPGAGVRSSGFSIRSTASGGSAGSGGSGGSGGAGYDRNADPAELFVRQDRIGACCFLSLSPSVLREGG